MQVRWLAGIADCTRPADSACRLAPSAAVDRRPGDSQPCDLVAWGRAAQAEDSAAAEHIARTAAGRAEGAGGGDGWPAAVERPAQWRSDVYRQAGCQVAFESRIWAAGPAGSPAARRCHRRCCRPELLGSAGPLRSCIRVCFADSMSSRLLVLPTRAAAPPLLPGRPSTAPATGCKGTLAPWLPSCLAARTLFHPATRGQPTALPACTHMPHRAAERAARLAAAPA